jgi:hypothetical protein
MAEVGQGGLIPVGNPRGRYKEHSGKFPSVVKPRFIEPVGERTKLSKVDAR